MPLFSQGKVFNLEDVSTIGTGTDQSKPFRLASRVSDGDIEQTATGAKPVL
jgi:hypothetical protein